jgi:hypothetical protein
MKSRAQGGEPARQKSLPGLSGATRPPLAAGRARKLHVGHFAFMRSVVQGLDVRHSWERYFRVEGDDSARHVKATIQWIRDEFAAAAKRQARPGTARLVLLDASRLGEPAAELPSLEAFGEQKGLADFSQADQIEAYEKEYGTASRRASRRARLISHQLEALRWLEGVVAEPPRAGDSVAAWLNPTLARRLVIVRRSPLMAALWVRRRRDAEAVRRRPATSDHRSRAWRCVG